ncbi:MAG: NAD(P)H-hydrate dehydratase [Gemmatimonadales bacterium]
MLPILTPEQSRAWDSAASAAGRPLGTLMESAGRAAAQVIAERYASRCRQGVLVAAGPGNNGGDGWVIARALQAVGLPVWVAASGEPGSELAVLQARLAHEDGVRTVAADGPWPAAGLLVDALLGTGASGPLRGTVADLAHRLADLDIPLIAVDGPTGLNLLDGVNHGPLQAALTITFGGFRRGHLLSRDDCGDLVVVDIGCPPAAGDWPILMTALHAARQLKPFPSDAHKGERGRVVVVGGDAGMTGAARLAARAAFGAGAGLVHIVAPAETVRDLAGSEPDVQSLAQPFDAALTKDCSQLLGRADAIVVGPGLGRGPGRDALVLGVLDAGRSPVVVDADGLMALQGRVAELAARAGRRPVLLTPHLGEFRALFPDLASDATVDPWHAAERAAELTQCTVLLKGVPTVIATPGRQTLTVAAGNPGLATGGSGDCLAGLAAAFLAQGVEPRTATGMAAQALGDAADIAARRRTARAMRPMDLLEALPDLWRHWARLASHGAPVRPPILHELPRPERG